MDSINWSFNGVSIKKTTIDIWKYQTMRFVLNTLRTLIVNQAIWHMHDKCYFNHKKYISFTGHDFTDMVFWYKTAKYGKTSTKNVSQWLFFHFQQTLQKITKKMIVFYKKKYFYTLILEKVDPYQMGRWKLPFLTETSCDQFHMLIDHDINTVNCSKFTCCVACQYQRRKSSEN